MKTFKPAEGKGYLWGLGLIAIVGILTLVPVIINLVSGRLIPGFVLVMGVVFLSITSIAIYFAWAAKSLQYSLDDQELVITWAFSKKRIPLQGIRGIERTIGTSSLKVIGASWPGFHMGSFTDPTGKGTVNLYATHIWGEIILIRTKWETIGITPADAEEFLGELERLSPEIESGSFSPAGDAEQYTPWKDKLAVSIFVLAGVILLGTGLYMYSKAPSLPSKVPIHYNIRGEIDRYGSPQELYTPLGIALGVIVMMAGINLSLARNNKTSVRMMAFVSLLISLIFSIISISMILSA